MIGATVLLPAPAVASPQAEEPACSPNSHWDGSACRCNPGYRISKGRDVCVPESDVCRAYGPSHLVGDDCVCNDGHGIPPGESRCVAFSAICARYDAVYDPAIRDCACPAGTVENERLRRCVPAKGE